MKPEELTRIPVSELTTPTIAFSPTDTVSKVVGFLRDSGSYEAFVEENGRTAFVSIRDLLGTTGAATARVASLMHYVPRLHTGSIVEEATTLMSDHRIRALPVYKGKRLVGRITSPSIVAMLDGDSRFKISSIMTANPVTAGPSDRLSKAKGLMIRRRIDQLPVMADGRLYGAVTSTQIVFNLMSRVDRNVKGDWREGRFDTPLEMFASRNAVTNDVGDAPKAVLENMSSNASNYSLIMSLGEVHGIVTYRDFIKLLVHRDSKETQMYMVGLPKDPFEAETAKSKFAAAVSLLRKGFPEVTEARAIIKMGDSMSPKKKYQVSILIMTPYTRYSYRVFSYELADAFDYVSGWVKRLVAQYKPRSKGTQRVTVPPFQMRGFGFAATAERPQQPRRKSTNRSCRQPQTGSRWSS